MSLDEILGPRREELRRLAQRHGARSVQVFGSAARGQARADSDLDLLVDLAPGGSLLDLIAIEQDATEILGRKVDVVTLDSVSPYLRERILGEAVPL